MRHARARAVRLRVFAVAAGVLALLIIGFASAVPITSERARRAVISALSARFNGTVELESFEFRVVPSLRAEGSGRTIRHAGRRDVPPLISIRRFWVTGSMWGALRGHASHMTVEGLDIEIPADRNRGDGIENGSDHRDTRPRGGDIVRTFVIDELVTIDARLVVIPRKSGRRARVWDIHRLRMESVGHQMMPFDAVLTNAVPPGEIETKGNFGPWNTEEPGDTPLNGSFVFQGADLGVFKGISGVLSSQGTFGGTLARIEAQGETDTPDFTVSVGGQPVQLHTRYRATVDGTNGDTILDRIDASFLHTALVAQGRVIDAPGVEGRTVTLDVAIEEGRIEDVLRFAVKADQPMVGALMLRTRLVLPPGNRSVVEKLRLDGLFTLTGAQFTNVDVGRKIAALSHRSRGRKPDGRVGRVSSNFAGRFSLAGGRLTIPAVTFDIPGAGVKLAGAYDLRRESLDFRGTLYTDVKLSRLTSGIKSLLLKPFDPLFGRDGGGAAIPIKVTGTRDEPSFGLDKGRLFSKE